MPRGESAAKVGYYPFGDEHLPAVASLFAPAAKTGGRIGDFFAGEGRALQALSAAWNLAPYASELDQGRAATCQALFGAEHVLHSAVEDLDITPRSLVVNWCNPPYSAISAPGAQETHRIEDLYMRRTAPYGMAGGYLLWVVYSHHVTLTASRWLTRYCDLIDIWRIPGFHLGEYVQVAVVCRMRATVLAEPDEARARALVAAGKALTDTRPSAQVKPDVLAAAKYALSTGKVQGVSVRELVVQPTPLYPLPNPLPETMPFTFSSRRPDPQLTLRLLQTTGGAFRTPDFHLRNRVPTVQDARVIHPVILPRREHLPLLIAAGVMDGVILEINGKRYAVRANITTKEELDPSQTKYDSEGKIVEQVYQTRTLTTVVLLDNEGQVTRLEGELALARFIEENRDALLAHVEQHFTPLYDLRKPIPDAWRELDTVRIKNKPLFAAQKAAVAAILTTLRTQRGMIFVGEPGVGKTAMGASVIRMRAKTWKPGQFALVTCPPHLVGKWQAELAMVIPSARVAILNDVASARQFVEAIDRDPSRLSVGIISREMAKLSERWEPSYRLVRKRDALRAAALQWPLADQDWRERLERARQSGGRLAALWVLRDWKTATRLDRKGTRLPNLKVPVCPTCGEAIVPGAEPGEEKKEREEKEDMFVSGVIGWLNKARRWCPFCNAPLWTEARRKPDIKHHPRSHPEAIVKRGWSRLPATVKTTPQVTWRADGTAAPRTPDRNPRMALAQYMKAHCRGRIAIYIADELHEGRNTQSAQGDAMMTLANAADRVLGLTGTLFSGLASGLFGIEYVFNPEVRGKYPWSKETGAKGDSHQRWILDMGCLERVIREDARVAATGRASGKTSLTETTREAPGATPLLVATVMEHTLFMDLANLGVDLPPIRREAIGVPMAKAQQVPYEDMVHSIKTELRENPRLASSYRQVALGWPNASFRADSVSHQGYVYHTLPALADDWIAPKEQRLIDLVQAQIADGRRCVVFVRQSDTRDIQPRIESLLRLKAGAHPFILKGSVDAKKRMDVYKREIDRGADVIICNPTLVATGLDLLETPTLIFYELVDDLLINQQSACRAWRIGQDKDCEVFYLYYTASGGEPTMEHKQALRQGHKEIAARRVSGRGGLALGTLGGKTQLDDLMDSFGDDSRIADPNQLFRQLSEMEAAQVAEAAWFARVQVAAPIAEVETLLAAVATETRPSGIVVPAARQTTFWSEDGLIVPGKAQPLFDLGGYTVTTAKSRRRR